MADIEGLTNEEIKELIFEQLRDEGVDIDVLEIEVTDGPRVIVKGKVGSEGEHYLIKKTIMDVVGIDDLEDELVVIDEPESIVEENDEGGLYNCDKDEELTEDAFESLEDGIPYTPPLRPLHDESDEHMTWKKRKNNKR